MVALPYCEVGVINFAVCWNSSVFIGTFMCKNLMSYTRSAGNLYTLRSLTSSSETTCETPFNLTKFNNHYTEQTGRAALDEIWLTWFIGFAEGDGALLASGNRVRFVLTQKEGTILYHIQATLGFGYVRHFLPKSGGVGYYRYIVEDNDNACILAHLFNGNLVLSHRLDQLKVWMTMLWGIKLIDTLVTPTINDAWLSGFADAEGCFNVKISARPNTVTGFRVGLRFLLDQKAAESLLIHVRNLLVYGQVSLRKETGQVYRYSNDSFTGLMSVRNYFLAFRLKSKKGISFTKWNEVYTMVLAKEHLTDEGLAKVRILAKEINEISSATTAIGSANP